METLTKTHSLKFWRIGHYRSHGFSFPCDENGNVSQSVASFESYQNCCAKIGKDFTCPELVSDDLLTSHFI